ncbi:MAG: diacylglycerol/lipid kinase family protein [Faecalibacterium prausnitzii]
MAYGIPQVPAHPARAAARWPMRSPLFKQLCGHIGRRVEYAIDGEVLTVDCLMCAVCNGRTYGGGFMAAREAQPDDGWLDVFIIRKVSRRDHCKAAGDVQERQALPERSADARLQSPTFIYRRAKSVSLRAADGRGPISCHRGRRVRPLQSRSSVQVQPLAGRVLLPLPAYQRFTAKKAGVK